MAKKKTKEITIRSSAAEYLTYIAATGDSPESYEMRYEDENIWLTTTKAPAASHCSSGITPGHFRQFFRYSGRLETGSGNQQTQKRTQLFPAVGKQIFIRSVQQLDSAVQS